MKTSSISDTAQVDDDFVGDPNLVTDAHLAALAIEHGLTLRSADRGFASFSELEWKNPLSA